MDKMEVDDADIPSQQFENFVDLAKVESMIDDLKGEDYTWSEKAYDDYRDVVSTYQEQPHLLNPHLPKFVETLLNYVRNELPLSERFHVAFKYLYQLSKVRTYKVLLKFLPHEVADLDFVLNALELQDVTETERWETRYMLLLWLSILVLNPFEMARFDSRAQDHDAAFESKSDRIFKLCKLNTQHNDTCAKVAAYLTANFLIRIDIVGKYVPIYIDWIQSDETVSLGKLAAISNILKHGKREDLLIHAETLLKWIVACNANLANDYLKSKYAIKILQRLGLVFLKPQLATWRYQRGSRSLAANLSAKKSSAAVEFKRDEITADDNDGDIEVPPEIEEILEQLLQAIRSPSSDIRWSTAKGLGRITSRLPKAFGDEVVESIIDIFSPLEPNEGWHGACLSIAELAKRGLLLPYRLEKMVPLLLQALVYDELKGYMSVGQHIRDAACYMCWAFARAYEPSVLSQFVNKIAAGLLITTVFDREINCRRAASAAFQECVGRLRAFPYGIDILTKADFFTVGNRSNAFLEISVYIAQYNDYSYQLIDHLIERKTNHWDVAIRELTAKTLHKLTACEPVYMLNKVLPKLLEKTSSIDINQRHGAVLAIGEIVLKLKQMENAPNATEIRIGEEIKLRVSNLIITFQERNQFRGLSGELMFQCCCDFIRNCSSANFDVPDECVDTWQSVIDAALLKNSTSIRDVAVAALSELCKAYYGAREIEKNNTIVNTYLAKASEELWEFERMGAVSAIGVLPLFMIETRLGEVLTAVITYSLTPAFQSILLGHRAQSSATVTNWSEGRRDAVKALSNLIQTIGFKRIASLQILDEQNCLNKIFECFLLALDEYTVDNRGDIGAWVREAAMNALYKFIVTAPHEYLDETKVLLIVRGLLQQAVEKIDRTRALAGKLFCKIIFHEPIIPHIKFHDEIKNMFPEDHSNIMWLHASHTFPLLCNMLILPEYTEKLLIGLIASIGQLSESLIKYSSDAFVDFMHKHEDHRPRICDVILNIFKKNVGVNDRITGPLLNFLNIVISSGCIDDIVLDASSSFSREVYRLAKLEIHGHKKFYKLISSINVFCQLIQVKELKNKIFATLAIFMGLPHVHVRKTTANKLYEALMLYSDVCEINDDDLDKVMIILSETDWSQPIAAIREIRNSICLLLGIEAPVAIKK